MPICNWAATPALNNAFAAPRYLALMNGDPTEMGYFTEEMTGDGYVRKLCPFSVANGRTVHNSETVWWADLPTTPIRYIAVITSLTGGNMVAYAATGSDIVIEEGKKFIVSVNDLSFTIAPPTP